MSEEINPLCLQKHGLLTRIMYCRVVGYLPCVSNIVILRSVKEYRADALNIAPCDRNSASYKGGCKLKNTLHMAQES